MAENTDKTTKPSAAETYVDRGFLSVCPICEQSAERIRIGAGTPKADGTPQDRYKCEACKKEFEDDAWVKVPASQATIGQAFKH